MEFSWKEVSQFESVKKRVGPLINKYDIWFILESVKYFVNRKMISDQSGEQSTWFLIHEILSKAVKEIREIELQRKAPL